MCSAVEDFSSSLRRLQSNRRAVMIWLYLGVPENIHLHYSRKHSSWMFLGLSGAGGIDQSVVWVLNKRYSLSRL